MAQSIAIRVDASSVMGIGHLQRCLSLADALRLAGADVRFVTRPVDFDPAPRIGAAGFPFVILPPIGGTTGPASDMASSHSQWLNLTPSDDADQTIAALQAAPPDWVVVDHYGIDARWHSIFRKALGARIAVIDDLADRPLDADLVIDHNLASPDHASKYRTRVTPSTRLLGGPRYALLAPAYTYAPRYDFDSVVRSIGIFMGGTDSGNTSQLVLDAVRHHAQFSGTIEIATTSANPHLERLRQSVLHTPNTTVVTDQTDLSSFFARHDLQIGAGGGAVWERCAIGCPSLTLVTAPNQQQSVPQLQAAGATATIDQSSATESISIGEAVAHLLKNVEERRTLATKSRELVDGHGARRVALRMTAEKMHVRPATAGDQNQLREWRNHPVVRNVSRHSEIITPERHEEWLRSVLDDPNRSLWIGQIGTTPIGCVRFDRIDKTAAEVSIHLDAALLGEGLGPRLLATAEAQYRLTLKEPVDLVAEVLADNHASDRLFATSGYTAIHNGWIKTLS